MRIITCLICIILMSSSPPLAAAPTGLQLRNACEIAITNGFKSNAGMLCEWYVRPCNCRDEKSARAPRVCLPDDVDYADLARKVVAGLKFETRLLTAEADLAAAIILSRSYPCAD
jgi:hypothetical protein